MTEEIVLPDVVKALKGSKFDPTMNAIMEEIIFQRKTSEEALHTIVNLVRDNNALTKNVATLRMEKQQLQEELNKLKMEPIVNGVITDIKKAN